MKAVTIAARFVAGVSVVGVIAGGMAGCLSRPVVREDPTTKDTVFATLRSKAVDKIDLLFSIDNSASMGDKQAFLASAVPDLVSRLVAPFCVDDSGSPVLMGGAALRVDANGACASGKAEFAPVHDMHIAIVSSSLGLRGGDICDPAGKGGPHLDDRAHLLNRTTANQPVAGESGENFLAWFPKVSANDGKTAGNGATPVVDVAALEAGFTALVSGAGQDGCGIESQLESWYRFLVQPDPYDTIDVSTGRARWKGVDATILQERHDFLRPDSLVAVIVLTDENDSEVDARAAGGTAFKFHQGGFKPPRGTSACDADPNSPDCTSCDYGRRPNDPSCKQNGGVYSAANDWGYDPNLRHVHMKAKYGLDPQYPIARYVNGLSQKQIPDRTGEYPTPDGSYVAKANCQNPLFAASLPDGTDVSPATLCNLPAGGRSPSNVFYGIIGGVPYELLHLDPSIPKSIEAPLALSAADWQKILGKDPEKYDYAGIDPHMIESYQPRPGLPPPTAANGADPIHGREWVTNPSSSSGARAMPFDVDREYACTFPLAQPRDCTKTANQSGCDCPTDPSRVPNDPTLLPPVCDPKSPTTQVAAKVYPTPRELLLAKKLQGQGIVASLCPVHTTDSAAGDDPFFGYRPAVAAIVQRLKDALTTQCLPEALTPAPSGPNGALEVPCLVLAVLEKPGPESACAQPGLSPPDRTVLAQFIRDHDAQSAPDAGSIGNFPICQVSQLTVASGQSCKDDKSVGFCYVQNTTSASPAGKCPQAIVFTQGTDAALKNATFNLQCINQYSGPDGG